MELERANVTRMGSIGFRLQLPQYRLHRQVLIMERARAVDTQSAGVLWGFGGVEFRVFFGALG